MSRRNQTPNETTHNQEMPPENAPAETTESGDERSHNTGNDGEGSASPTSAAGDAAAPPEPTMPPSAAYPRTSTGEIGSTFKAVNKRLSKSESEPKDQSHLGKPFKPTTRRLPGSPGPQPKSLEGHGAAFKPKVPDYVHGISCPKCKSKHFASVKDSRPRGNLVRRERVCKNCNQKFTTTEKIEPPQSKAA